MINIDELIKDAMHQKNRERLNTLKLIKAEFLKKQTESGRKTKELTDDEMIEHYTGLVKEYGGKLTAKWLYGMVIYDGKTPKEYSWAKSHFYFVDTPCEKRNPGYPLDSMSIMPSCNKYFVDLTDEDRKLDEKNYNEDDVIEFIVRSVK